MKADVELKKQMPIKAFIDEEKQKYKRLAMEEAYIFLVLLFVGLFLSFAIIVILWIISHVHFILKVG